MSRAIKLQLGPGLHQHETRRPDGFAHQLAPGERGGGVAAVLQVILVSIGRAAPWVRLQYFLAQFYC
jgi:hypothetical protein